MIIKHTEKQLEVISTYNKTGKNVLLALYQLARECNRLKFRTNPLIIYGIHGIPVEDVEYWLWSLDDDGIIKLNHKTETNVEWSVVELLEEDKDPELSAANEAAVAMVRLIARGLEIACNEAKKRP